MDNIWFESVDALYRTAMMAVLAYAALVFFLRISGRRTLSKLNAFDFVITVALGSTLATILLNKNVTLAEGVLAFAMLIGLQYVITWSSVRAPWIRQLVTGEPALLFYQGAFLDDAMRRARIAKAEIRAAVRAAGLTALGEVHAVVIETDGSLSVVRKNAADACSSLEGVALPKKNP